MAIIVSSLALVQPTSATEASRSDFPPTRAQFPDPLPNGVRTDALCLQRFPDSSRERLNLGLMNNAKEELTLRLPAMVLDEPIARGQEQSWVFGGSARQGSWVATFIEPYTEGQAYITCGFENDFFTLPQHQRCCTTIKGGSSSLSNVNRSLHALCQWGVSSARRSGDAHSRLTVVFNTARLPGAPTSHGP